MAGFLGGSVTAASALHVVHFARCAAQAGIYAADLAPACSQRTACAPVFTRLKGLFWVRASTQRGAGLDLRADEDAFLSVYPGYAAAREDREVWKRYKRRGFQGSVYSPLLSRHQDAVAVVSPDGGVDLFSRHGADVLLLGNSETYASIVPAELARRLAGAAGLPAPKVLPLAESGDGVTEIKARARALALTGRRARLAVVGYSFWFAGGRAPGPLRGWGALRRGPLWSDLIPMRVQTDGPEELLGPPGDWFLPLPLLEDPAAVSRRASRMRPFYKFLKGLGPQSCALEGESARIDELLSALKAVAGKTLLYIPPATPLLTDYAPSCLLPAVRELLLSKRGVDVHVATGDWKSYGLDWPDYARAAQRPGWAVVDPNHPNFKGAMKATAVLAELLSPAW